MAFSVVESVGIYSSGGNLTSNPVTLPTGIQAGDLLLMFISSNSSTTVNLPSGWTTILSLLNSPSFTANCNIFAKIATGSEGATQTVTTASPETMGADTYRISGWNGVIADDIVFSTSSPSTGAAYNPPNVIAPWGVEDNLFIAATHDGPSTSSGPSTGPANYTQIQPRGAGGNQSGWGLGTAHRSLAAASDNPGSFTGEVTTDVSINNTLIIRPAGGTVHDGAATLDGVATLVAEGTSTPPPSATLSDTILDATKEEDIVAGGKVVSIDLTGATFVP